ncbi:uncharacterized protein LOC144203446 [Stigmatopora nigra]
MHQRSLLGESSLKNVIQRHDLTPGVFVKIQLFLDAQLTHNLEVTGDGDRSRPVSRQSSQVNHLLSVKIQLFLDVQITHNLEVTGTDQAHIRLVSRQSSQVNHLKMMPLLLLSSGPCPDILPKSTT